MFRTYYKGMIFGTTADIYIERGAVRCHAVNYDGIERSKMFFDGDTAPSPYRIFNIYPIDIQYTVVSSKATVKFFEVEYSKALTVSEDIIECVIPSLTDRIFFNIIRLHNRGFLDSVNQSELARIVGCTRSWINRTIKQCPYISVCGHKMVVTSTDSLINYAMKISEENKRVE